MIGDDLVNSYHLLLCCLDLVFANAILCPNRRDLLNPSFKGTVGMGCSKWNTLCSFGYPFLSEAEGWSSFCFFSPTAFPGLPADFHAPEMKASEDPPCIIATLCELHDGLLVEAKGIKEHYFKPYISKLFDRKVRITIWRMCDSVHTDSPVLSIEILHVLEESALVGVWTCVGSGLFLCMCFSRSRTELSLLMSAVGPLLFWLFTSVKNPYFLGSMEAVSWVITFFN